MPEFSPARAARHSFRQVINPLICIDERPGSGRCPSSGTSPGGTSPADRHIAGGHWGAIRRIERHSDGSWAGFGYSDARERLSSLRISSALGTAE